MSINEIPDLGLDHGLKKTIINNQRRLYLLTFLLWLILLVLCWPLALLALILYPIVWLVLLPFRILGIAVQGILALIKAVIMLPARIIRGPSIIHD
jgi:hypothetical protein